MKLNRSDYIFSDPILRDELLLLFGKEERLTIFDIGSCEGEDAIRYSRVFPRATVYAFEPRPDNIELIKKNLQSYAHGRIVVSETALSDIDGEAELYLSSGRPDNDVGEKDWDFGNKSSSLLPPSEVEIKKHTAWLKFEKTLKVKMITLDRFVKENRIGTIDFAHIDVQGAELMVLRGAGDALQSIKAIWLEVELVELYKNQPLKWNVEEFLVKSGFFCVKENVDAVSGDQLYLNHRYFGCDMRQKFYNLASMQHRYRLAYKFIKVLRRHGHRIMNVIAKFRN
jgi:FkbM family methyltransferase